MPTSWRPNPSSPSSPGDSEFLLREAGNQVALARNQIETAQAKLRANQEAINQKRAVASFDLEQFRRAIDQARPGRAKL